MTSRRRIRRQFTESIKAVASRVQAEPLEARMLLSAWSTVDSQLCGVQGVGGMTTDKSGNVYAVGDIFDSNGDDFVLREKASNSPNWATLYSFGVVGTQNKLNLNGVAVDAKGDVFVAGVNYASASWMLWELPQGSGSPVVIDRATGDALAVAVDPTGNAYTVGRLTVTAKGSAQSEWAVRKGTLNSATGSWTFSTVDQVATASTAKGVGIVPTTVGGTPSTAIYVVGSVGSSWVVRKSVDGGSWSQVDSFRYDSTGTARSEASGVAADASGNLYLVGLGAKGTITGRKTTVYNYPWVVRKSTNGGASWNTDDDVSLASATGNDYATAVCANSQTGAMEVAGVMHDSANVPHAVVRSNATGTWSFVDDYTGSSAGGALYSVVAADPSGNVYAGGQNNDNGGSWFIRSQPTAPTNLTASPDPVLPSSQIDLSWANAAVGDDTGFAIYRSTDGINFTLVTTVTASATSYADSGLSPGTKYYYYVVALLNSDGSSAPSATVSATTSA